MSRTTRHFLEVNQLWMGSHLLASCKVGVHVALLQPRVVVGSETVWRDFTRLFTVFHFLELSKYLRASFDVETFVNGYSFPCD